MKPKKNTLILVVLATMYLSLFIGCAASAGNAITITSPTPNTTVIPGQTINVSVVARPSITVHHVLALIQGDVETAKNGPPWNIELVVPKNASGQLLLSVVAFGNKEGTKSWDAEDVVLYVDTSSLQLKRLVASPDLIVCPATQPCLSVQVNGHYSNGAVRDVTSDTSTLFTPQFPGIVAIDRQGNITTKKAGESRIDIEHRGFKTSIVVIVEDNP